MRYPSYLPNLLSSVRIALAPGMLGAAYSNSRIGFVVLLGVALLTDALDGYLARRTHSETEIGRRLDRWGDALTMGLGALGLYFLWPVQFEAEWPATALALLGYFLLGIDRLWQRPDDGSEMTGWRKALALLVPLSLVPLIADWSAWPFRVAAVVHAVMGLKAFSAGHAAAASAKLEVPAVPLAVDESTAKAEITAAANKIAGE